MPTMEQYPKYLTLCEQDPEVIKDPKDIRESKSVLSPKIHVLLMILSNWSFENLEVVDGSLLQGLPRGWVSSEQQTSQLCIECVSPENQCGIVR